MLFYLPAFGDSYELINRNVFDSIGFAADPFYLYAIDLFMLAQSEMQPRSVMALVAPAAVDLIDLCRVPGDHLYPCSDSVPICFNAS